MRSGRAGRSRGEAFTHLITPMPRSFVYLLALALVAGCAQSDNDSGYTDVATEELSAAPAAPPLPSSHAEVELGDPGARQMALDGAVGGASAPVAPAGMQLPTVLPDSALGRRLIRTGEVGLVVDDVAAARREVATAARRAGGLVSGESENRHGERTEVRLTLRIPAARFDEVLDALTADGDAVAYRNVRVEDVTEVMVDVEARLRARRAVLDRYLQILARADEVGEILAVESKVAETQEAIEAAEGQLRALRDRVGLSTLEVTISDGEAGALAGGPPFLRRLGDAFEAGLAGVADLALAVVALWPLWLVGTALFFALRPALRRRRVRRETIPTGPVGAPPPAMPAA
jgi:hypothetical protein